MSYVKLERKDHIAILTIDRPEALNAQNEFVRADLIAAVNEIENDRDIYVVILTGSGRAFMAGADIAEMYNYTPYQGMSSDQLSMSLAAKLEGLRQPVIAAINGFALGGGCELAMACDIRIASEKAKFGLPEVTLGIIPGNGGAQRLARIAGTAKAMELTLTGRIFDAAEAKKIGLVSYVYPHEELMDKAMEMAQTICSNAQISVQQYKWIMRTALDANTKAGCAMEYLADSVCFSTNDKYEGMSAFLEKRDEKHFTFS